MTQLLNSIDRKFSMKVVVHLGMEEYISRPEVVGEDIETADSNCVYI